MDTSADPEGLIITEVAITLWYSKLTFRNNASGRAFVSWILQQTL